MKRDMLRRIYVWLMLAAHLTVAGFTFYVYAAGGLDFSQFTTLLSIVLPVFAMHLATVIGWLLKSEGGRADIPVNAVIIGKNLAAVSIVVPVSLFAGMIVLVSLYGWTSTFGEFDELKHVMLAFESVMAGIMAAIVATIFEKPGTASGDK